MDFRILKFRPPQATPATAPARLHQSHQHRKPHPAPPGHAGHRVLLGGDRGRGAAHPALRRLRRAASPAGADVPGGAASPATAGTSSRRAPARSSAMSCTITRRCRASGCRWSSRWCSCLRACGWSARCPASAHQVRIGLPVRATYVRPDSDPRGPTLPAWRPGRGDAPGPGDRRDAHVRDRLGAGHPRLPGRAPRPGPRRRAGSQGHLRQHPDHHRSCPALRLDLGAPTRWSAPCPSGWACPATPARRSPSAAGSPRGPQTAASGLVSVTGRCGLGDHVTATVRIGSSR